jgi:cell division septum initiation protein DivIVA
VDVHDKLDEITRLVEDARAMPMSASCLVNREEVLALLDELRALLPEQLEHADLLLSDRDNLLARGHETAQMLVEEGREEHDRLVEQQSVVVAARERATAITEQAAAESTRLLADADEYVDRKLAEFEIALDKVSAQVRRGRERLGERRVTEQGRHAAQSPAGAGLGESDSLG